MLRDQIAFWVCIAILAFLVWMPATDVELPRRRSLMLASYEIPNPHKSVLLTHAALAFLPALGLAAVHRPVTAACALLAGAALFHVRNLAVRAENERGEHDPALNQHITQQK
ncbi:hypothetical protein G3A43_06945 [Paraburkholderia aspalathi]|nr:hypothetical protein [Paraburkholderia aspalathi]MBK3779988.1 hypothetical protein [Paraburkholderia aspalathi]